MNELQLLTGPVAQAIGWALLHLLWQATIVAGILAAVLSLMSRQSANARYIVSCGALALVFSMFVATAVRAYDPAAAPVAASAATTETIKISLTDIPVLVAQTAAAGLKDRALSAFSSARGMLPSVVGLWLAGVVLLSARLLVSWVRARRLVRRAARPAAPELQLMAIRLSDALGLRGAVKLLQSAAVEVPSVIGSLRPVVLIPASALTGLTPEQIEMVLAHELAHIRRHDFLVNLLQAVVETLMFYHPAVWWMSRRVRIERENCCDDLAVAVCGNPIQYARALTRLEELRASTMTVVVAANGGSLLERIRRIAADRAEGTVSTARWAAALALLAVLVIAVAVPSLPAFADRNEEKKKSAAKSQPASSKIDVVEVSPEARLAIVDMADDDDDDYDYDYGIDAPEAPEPPEPPEIALHGLAPLPPNPAIPGVPAPAPAPHVYPAPFARPGHPAPPAPPAMLAMLDRNRADDELEYEYEYEHGDDKKSDRPIGEGGKLTVDELISLRAVGVTPEYVNTMRELFPGLTLRGVTSMKAVGVSTEFIRQMRSAGFEVKTAREATSLAAVGVTPEYVQQMRSAGFDVKTAKEATSLKAVGVTPEFISEMRDAGFAVTSAKDASGLAAVGVTSAWVRGMKAAGVNITSARDAQSMKAVGVTPEFVQRLAKAGYTNLTARELARMAAAGIDDDFIREMEQYRKKN
ncbi:MAG TPA: M56 family metallopeptidase [Thermoanaerobaculia bacterium]|nr:M56 family metallopeptidase [Thermoanaerobaculia bacterium]